MFIPKETAGLPLNIAGYLAAIGVAAYAAKIAKGKLSEKFVPVIGLCALLIFLLQSFRLPALDNGESRFIGGLLAATLLGPWPGFLVMSAVIALRSIISNDFGLANLGLNIINLGWVAGIAGTFVLGKLKKRFPHKRQGFMLALGIASWASVILAASAVELELALIKIMGEALTPESGWRIGTYIILGIMEALITTGVVSVVLNLRPDLVVGYCCGGEKEACYAGHHHVQTHTHPAGDLGHHDHGHTPAPHDPHDHSHEHKHENGHSHHEAGHVH